MANNDPNTKRTKGNGPGWGGPAKGGSASRYGKENPPLARTKEVNDRAAERREKVLELYESVVDNKRAPVMARLVAGDKLLDRIDGKPVALNINHNVGDPSRLSDAELAAIASAGRDASPSEEGNPPELGDVVH